MNTLSSVEFRSASRGLSLLGASPTYAREALAAHIKEHGPIKTVRVSSARARGRAKKYCYWGAALYEIRVLKNGRPGNVSTRRASSDRRRYELAESDADATGRLRLQTIGELSEIDCAQVLERLL